MISLSRMVLPLALVTLVSCGDVVTPEWEDRVAQRQWARRGAASYSITVSRDCFCLEETMGPVIVTVADGQIQSRRYEATGAAVPEAYAGIFPSIEGLFEIVEAARRRDARLFVTFDPEYGYPARIEIDMDQRPVDGGVIWLARDLVLR